MKIELSGSLSGPRKVALKAAMMVYMMVDL